MRRWNSSSSGSSALGLSSTNWWTFPPCLNHFWIRFVATRRIRNSNRINSIQFSSARIGMTTFNWFERVDLQLCMKGAKLAAQGSELRSESGARALWSFRPAHVQQSRSFADPYLRAFEPELAGIRREAVPGWRGSGYLVSASPPLPGKLQLHCGHRQHLPVPLIRKYFDDVRWCGGDIVEAIVISTNRLPPSLATSGR